MIEVKTFYEYVKDWAKADGDRVFLFDERRNFTVKQALSASTAAANELFALGIRARSKVALRCTRSADACLIYLALQYIGAITFMTDPHESRYDTVNGVKVDAYVTNGSSGRGISDSGDWIVCMGGDKTPFVIECASAEPCFDIFNDMSAPTTVVFTSGSTGAGKAVMLSQMNIVRISTDTYELGWYLKEDIALGILPVHHVFGLSLLVTAIVARYAIFFPKSVDVPYILECVERYKITRMNGVPTLYLAMANANETEKRDVKTLRTGFIGGAPVTEDKFRYIEKTLGVRMIPIYGMSECMGIACSSYEDDVEKRCRTVGKFYEMSRGYIINDGGNELPRGEVGEVCVRSPAVTLGYYDDPEATKEAIDSLGRLHTGDLGYVDDEGYLHICGRKKDIIIRNGINISCGKIEQALLSLDGVNQAAAVAVAHERFGEVPAALVVSALSPEDIAGKLSKILTKIEMPLWIIAESEMPLTSSGKPDKIKIRETIEKKCKA